MKPGDLLVIKPSAKNLTLFGVNDKSYVAFPRPGEYVLLIKEEHPTIKKVLDTATVMYRECIWWCTLYVLENETELLQ